MPEHESKCPQCGTWHLILLGANNAVPGEVKCPQCGNYSVREIRPKNNPKMSHGSLEQFLQN